ncbi:MAG: MATE family efflux transporter [Bacteroidales bacterium]
MNFISDWHIYKPHYSRLIYLSILITFGQMAMVLLSFFDTLMVGKYGTLDLAAASFTGAIVFLPLMFLQGIAMGIIPLSGAAYGRKDTDAAGAYLRDSLLVGFLCMLFCMLLMGLLYLALPLIQEDKDLLKLIKPLFLIHLFSMPFVMIFNTGKQFTDSITQTKISMYIIFSGVGLNIILNYILINGIGLFPPLGVIGAGIATFISRFLMALAYILVIIYAKHLKPYFQAAKKANWDKKRHIQLQKIGWPIATQLVLEGAGFSLTTLIAGWISTQTMAAHQILASISQLCFLLYFGLGSAISVRVSNFMGQKRYKDVQNTVHSGFQLMMILVIFNCILILFTRFFIGKLFTNDLVILQILPIALIPLVIYQIADAIQAIYVNALRGIGKVKSIASTSFISYICISLPLSYIFGVKMGFGLPGIWSAFPISLTVASIIYYISYRKFIKEIH